MAEATGLAARGSRPEAFAGAGDLDGIRAVTASLPSNHSPHFAPVIDPTLELGVQALVVAARTWLEQAWPATRHTHC